MTVLFLESSTNTDGDYLIFIGLLQFLVGVVQVFGAFIRTIVAIATRKNPKRIMTYWGMVVFYFLVLYLFSYFHWNIFIWMPLAWLIAIWYCFQVVFVNHQSNSN